MKNLLRSVVFSISFFVLTLNSHAADCYLSDTMTSSYYQSCQMYTCDDYGYIYKWEARDICYADYATDSVGPEGNGECACGAGSYNECWPEFLSPYGYSTGSPTSLPWVGRWSQTVNDMGIDSYGSFFYCTPYGYDSFESEEWCAY
jgi:hypothetical protein